MELLDSKAFFYAITTPGPSSKDVFNTRNNRWHELTLEYQGPLNKYRCGWRLTQNMWIISTNLSQCLFCIELSSTVHTSLNFRLFESMFLMICGYFAGFGTFVFSAVLFFLQFLGTWQPKTPAAHIMHDMPRLTNTLTCGCSVAILFSLFCC